MYCCNFSYLHKFRKNASRKSRVKNMSNNWNEQVDDILDRFDLHSVYFDVLVFRIVNVSMLD